MTRPVKLPPGASMKDGNISLPGPKSRDSSQARSWAKGGRKNKQRVAKKGVTSLLNSIGKLKR